MQNSDSDSGESTKTVALSPKQENSLTMGPKIPLPVLSEGNIEAFFYSIEFWFEASGITSDTKKFNIICATLPPNKLMEMKTIIDAVPSAKKYDYIKVKLIEHYADSEQKRVRRVLSDMPLGDRKPSELYNEMKRVAGKSLGDSILLDLWITRLPSHVQPAIIASKVAIEEKLKNSEISNLKNQVNQLSRDMQKLLQKKKNIVAPVLVHTLVRVCAQNLVYVINLTAARQRVGIIQHFVRRQQNVDNHAIFRQSHNDNKKVVQFQKSVKVWKLHKIIAYVFMTPLPKCIF